MNNFSNFSQNFSFYMPLDFWLSLVGSNYLLDSLYLCLFSPIAIIGCILNLLCLLILKEEEFRTNLYTYLRHSCFCSFLITLVYSFVSIAQCRRFFPIGNSYWSAMYWCYPIISFITTAYCYSGVLDIAILVDRLSFFAKTLKKCAQISPKLLSFCALGACIALSLPVFFFYVPFSIKAKLADNYEIDIYFAMPTSFLLTHTGKSISNTLSALRDGLTLFVVISLNVSSAILLRKQLKIKASLKFKDASNKIDSARNSNTASALMLKSNIRSFTMSEQKATLMVIFSSILTIMERSMLFLLIIFINCLPHVDQYPMIFLSNFSICLKASSNFFVFFFFNKIFKKKVYSLLCKTRSS